MGCRRDTDEGRRFGVYGAGRKFNSKRSVFMIFELPWHVGIGVIFRSISPM